MGLRVQSGPEAVKSGIGKTRPPVAMTGRENKKTAMPKENASWEEVAKEPEIFLAQVEFAVESINGAMEFINRGLKFSLHEGANRVMVQVINLATQEVIKEIPPQKLLDTVARIREMIGLLLDEWA